MTEEHARAIVDGWRYEGEYAVYDYINEAEHMLDPSGWGRGVFAVLDETGELAGELSIEFFDQDEKPTPYGDFADTALISSREMWIGFGLRPDLTGRGLGEGFVTACVDFALRHTGYGGEYVHLGVANFNRRAITVYERSGFRSFHETKSEIGGKTLAITYMRKRLRAARTTSRMPDTKGYGRP